MTFIIAGLGNPGDEYVNTRHNTGRIIAQQLHAAFDGDDWKFDKKLNATVARAAPKALKKNTLHFVLPETFMNKSGGAIKPLVSSEKKAEQLVVIYDDLDLPIGSFKISFNRGSGGHRGLESIAKALKTEKFARIRVGISPVTASGKTKKPSGGEAVEKHILGNFKDAEMKELKKVSKKVAEAIEMMVLESREKAMSVFNAG